MEYLCSGCNSPTLHPVLPLPPPIKHKHPTPSASTTYNSLSLSRASSSTSTCTYGRNHSGTNCSNSYAPVSFPTRSGRQKSRPSRYTPASRPVDRPRNRSPREARTPPPARIPPCDATRPAAQRATREAQPPDDQDPRRDATATLPRRPWQAQTPDAARHHRRASAVSSQPATQRRDRGEHPMVSRCLA